MHKRFKCLDISTGPIYTSRYMVFAEEFFLFADLHPNVGVHHRKEIVLLPSHLLNPGGVTCIDPIIINPTNDSLRSSGFQDQSAEDGTQNDEVNHVVEESQPHTGAEDLGGAGFEDDPPTDQAPIPEGDPPAPSAAMATVLTSPNATCGGISHAPAGQPASAPTSSLHQSSTPNQASPRVELTPIGLESTSGDSGGSSTCATGSDTVAPRCSKFPHHREE